LSVTLSSCLILHIKTIIAVGYRRLFAPHRLKTGLTSNPPRESLFNFTAGSD
jgi:hypothetical protein